MDKGVEGRDDFVEKIIGLVKERADFMKDLWEHAEFFFTAPDGYDEKVVTKRWKPGTGTMVSALIEVLVSCEPFTSGTLELLVKTWIETQGLNPGAVMNAWRLALVGTSKGPALFEIAALLGREETISRMKKAILVLG